MNRAIACTLVTLILACRPGEEAPPPQTGQADPSQVIAEFNRGVALMEQLKPRDAVTAFRAVVDQVPDWPTGRLNLGIALLNTQTESGYREAEQHLKRVLEYEPTSPHAHYALAMLYRHLQRHEDAEAELLEVLKTHPEDGDSHYQLGLLRMSRDPDAAMAHFQRVIDAIPHHQAACYRLSTLLKRSGEHERAEKYLKRYQQLKSSGSGVEPVMKYGSMGRFAAIIRHADLDHERDPLPFPEYRDRAEELGLQTNEVPDQLRLYGPSIAAARATDGEAWLLFRTGAGGGLLRAGGDLFIRPQPGSGIDGDRAISACFGDYDGDGDPDLALGCDGPNRLFENRGDDRFIEVTAERGLGDGQWLTTAVCWVDSDHDGDLDLAVTNHGGPDQIWVNDRAGRFTPVNIGEATDSPGVASVFLDIDHDRDLDLYIVNQGAANQVMRNDRLGRFTDISGEFPLLADSGEGIGAISADYDRNGLEDILLLNRDRAPVLLLQLSQANFVRDESLSLDAACQSAVSGDFDLDGDADLLFLDIGPEQDITSQFWINQGSNGWQSRRAPIKPTGTTARGALALDLDRNGTLEILIDRMGAPPNLLAADARSDRHWFGLRIALPKDKPQVVEGLHAEIKTATHLQTARMGSWGGIQSSPPRTLHFGLGAYDKLDYLRLDWPDAVIQTDLELPSDTIWQVEKVTRKASSCPILFSWDGDRYRYVTDFLGVGGLGFFIAPGVYAAPDPDEHVRIDPHLIRADDGVYKLRIAEPLEEVSYIDQLKLLVYDHPQRLELYPDERFTSGGRPADGHPHTVADRITPLAAVDHSGRDMLDRLLRIDRRYVEPPLDPRFPGYARDHWVELDFGDSTRLEGSTLFLYGWIEYTYSHVNYAAYQAGVALESPSLEVAQPDGSWREVISDLGFPAGLPRMMSYDLDNLPEGARRIRIRSNMQIYWDQVFIAHDAHAFRPRIHELLPHHASLHRLGYPQEYSPDGRLPTLYDYHRIERGVHHKNLSGHYTRFGDVRPLLRETDDRYVIMGRGEELALAFAANVLPELEPGWTRTVVLVAQGYCKDMDLYTAAPDTTEPVPFRDMDGYPPNPAQEPPASFTQDQREWHTRFVSGDLQ